MSSVKCLPPSHVTYSVPQLRYDVKLGVALGLASPNHPEASESRGLIWDQWRIDTSRWGVAKMCLGNLIDVAIQWRSVTPPRTYRLHAVCINVYVCLYIIKHICGTVVVSLRSSYLPVPLLTFWVHCASAILRVSTSGISLDSQGTGERGSFLFGSLHWSYSWVSVSEKLASFSDYRMIKGQCIFYFSILCLAVINY